MVMLMTYPCSTLVRVGGARAVQDAGGWQEYRVIGLPVLMLRCIYA